MYLEIKRSLKKDLTYNDAKREILSDREFLKELELAIGGIGISENQAIGRCKKYLGEIAARCTDTENRLFWSISEYVTRKKIIGSFGNIHYNKEGVRIIKELAGKSIINVLPNHRSVFDFMILSYIIVKETSFMPIITAASVFDLFPLGSIFRRWGAYFVRRDEKDPLYFLVLRYYVMLVLKYELVHLFFIEGGRNKEGGYSNPKTGILEYLLEGAKKHRIKKSIAFIPVNISYDYVPESNVVVQENASGKRKHIFNSVINYATKKNLGNCYINFGNPVKLSPNQINSGRGFAKSLGNSFMDEIRNLVVVSPISLLCYTLAESYKKERISLSGFRKRFGTNFERLKKSGMCVSFVDLKKIMEYIEFAEGKEIIEFDRKRKTIIIGHKKWRLIRYCSNNIRHLFEI